MPVFLRAGPSIPLESFEYKPISDVDLSKIDSREIIEASVESIDNSDRSQVLDFYHTFFSDDAVPAMKWTGSDEEGLPGTIAREFQSAILRRINAYRALAGLPGDAVLIPSLSEKTQQGAFMTSHRDWASHVVSPRIPYYTEDAGEAVSHSNLLLGETGPRGIDLFIEDRGAHNYGVGHRRWLLYPDNRYMGVGAVPFRAYRLREALVVWVVGGTTPMPDRKPEQVVLWPTPGYFPLPLVPERWSLSLPEGDFSEAQVEAFINGQSVDPQKERLVPNLAENTLVWRFDSLARTGYSEDMVFEITVSNIRHQGELRSYSYTTQLLAVD